MPPKGKLPDAVIADFEKWIADGALDPRAGATAANAAGHRPREGPAVLVVPAAEAAGRARQRRGQIDAIDAFVLAKWNEKGLTPVAAGRQADADPPASRST